MTKNELIAIIEKLRKFYTTSDEAIPDYTSLEIENVFFCYKRVVSSGYYCGFNEKLTNLIFNVVKGHYLNNGNKRVTLILSFIFSIESRNLKSFDIVLMKQWILEVAKNKLDKEDLKKLIEKQLLMNRK